MTPQDRWQQPQRPESAPEPERPFEWVGGGMWVCLTCGAGVPTNYRDLHQRWHGGIPVQRVRQTVHGLTTPEDDASPSRYLELETGLPPEKVLDTLRAWATGLGADLSFREPTGFRATFNPQGWGSPQSHGARLGVEVRTAPAGTRVRCLLVPNHFVPATSTGLLSATAELALQVARFDELEAAIRRHIERR